MKKVYFLDFKHEHGFEVPPKEWDYLRRIEKNLRKLNKPVYVVKYCTAEGLIPGILRLEDDYLDFIPTIPNPFEGNRTSAETVEGVGFKIEYGDIQRDGIFPTPVPNSTKRWEEIGCGIDYHIQIHVLDTGERFT